MLVNSSVKRPCVALAAGLAATLLAACGGDFDYKDQRRPNRRGRPERDCRLGWRLDNISRKPAEHPGAVPGQAEGREWAAVEGRDAIVTMRQLQTYFRRKLRRVGALLAAAVIAALVASCGGDFDYKISGDRPADETRKGTGEYEALSTSSHEDVLKLQERYQAKVESEAGKK